MLKFRATDQQLSQMMANAVNASQPVGMGHYQYDRRKTYSPDDFPVEADAKGAFLDYVGGRMVKFGAWREEEPGAWKTHIEARPDFESWCHKYPSYQALAESVGAEILPEEPTP